MHQSERRGRRAVLVQPFRDITQKRAGGFALGFCLAKHLNLRCQIVIPACRPVYTRAGKSSIGMGMQSRPSFGDDPVELAIVFRALTHDTGLRKGRPSSALNMKAALSKKFPATSTAMSSEVRISFAWVRCWSKSRSTARSTRTRPVEPLGTYCRTIFSGPLFGL